MFILYICGTLRKQFSRKIKFNVNYADTFTNTKMYNISCLLLILIIIKNISLIWRAKNLNSIQAYPIFIHQILYWIFFFMMERRWISARSIIIILSLKCFLYACNLYSVYNIHLKEIYFPSFL